MGRLALPPTWVGMGVALLAGLAGLTACAVGWRTAGGLLTTLAGAPVAAVTPATVGMELRTYGSRGVAGSGYLLFCEVLLRAAAEAVVTPSPPSLSRLWLVIHACAATRGLAVGLWAARTHRRPFGCALWHASAYTVACIGEALLTLTVVYGWGDARAFTQANACLFFVSAAVRGGDTRSGDGRRHPIAEGISSAPDGSAVNGR